MRIIKSERALAITEYSLVPVSTNQTSSVIAISFHTVDGDLFPTPNTALTFYTLDPANSAGITMRALLAYLGCPEAANAPAARITVVTGGPVRVRADVANGDVIRSNIKDGPFDIHADEILCIGAKHPISTEESFTVILDRNPSTLAKATNIVTPGSYFKLSAPTFFSNSEEGSWVNDFGFKLCDKTIYNNLNSQGQEIGAAELGAGGLPHFNSLGGLNLDFGSGDVTRFVNNPDIFSISNGLVNTNKIGSILNRHAVGEFNPCFLGVKLYTGNTAEPGPGDNLNRPLTLRINVSSSPFKSFVYSAKYSTTGSPLGCYWMKAVASPVNVYGYFADAEGFFWNEMRNTLNGGLEVWRGKFINWLVPANDWVQVNTGAIPWNASAFLGRKTGDVYIIKTPGGIKPDALQLDVSSNSANDVNSYIDTSRNTFVLSVDSKASLFNNNTSNSGGGTTGPIIPLSNIRVASTSASAASVSILLYTAGGLCVSRQTITVPVSAVTLSSLISGFSNEWIAAKITLVQNSNFWIIESDGTVAPGSGAQQIVVGDYSANPIVINPEVL